MGELGDPWASSGVAILEKQFKRERIWYIKIERDIWGRDI